jgi:hypothetical protein
VNGKTRFLPNAVRQQLLMRGLSFKTRCSHRQWRSCVLGSRGTPRIEDPWSLC